MLKVAHVIRVFSYGGAEISLKEILSTDSFRHNVESDLFILDHKKLGLVGQVIPNIRNYYIFKMATLLCFWEFARFIIKISINKYDIVHMHLSVAGWMGITAKLFSPKTCFVFTEHTMISSLKSYNYIFSGLTYGFNDCVISVSEEVSVEIQKCRSKYLFNRKKEVTILNGVDTDRFYVPERLASTNAEKLIVGLVARLRPHKRLDKWLEIAEEIHRRNKLIRFVIVGDGPEFNLLKQHVETHHLNEIVELAGKTEDTLNAYRHIDVFLLTSDLEGLPLALMEAMSCGCVPVVNNVGGIKQLHFDGTGFKFSEYDTSVIAERIVDYSNHRDKYSNESRLARAFAVQSFSLNQQAIEIIQLYGVLLKERTSLKKATGKHK